MQWTELLDIPLDQGLWVLLSVCIASVIRAFTGFGFAMLAVPVFSLFLVPGDAVVLSASLALILGVIGYKAWWGRYPTEPVVPMLSGSLLGTATGVWFLASLSVAEFQLWIGLSVVLASVLLARYQPVERQVSTPVSLGTGVASGLMNGAFAIPGPPVVMFVVATLPNPVQSRAFLMMFFVFSNIVSLTMFALADLMSTRPFQLLWVALPALWMGDRLGNWAFERYSGRAYRPFVVALCIAIGLSISIKALWWS